MNPQSPSTSSANTTKFHIVFKNDQYRVFDKKGLFRRSFSTKKLAEVWIEDQCASTHNKRLSAQEPAAL